MSKAINLSVCCDKHSCLQWGWILGSVTFRVRFDAEGLTQTGKMATLAANSLQKCRRGHFKIGLIPPYLRLLNLLPQNPTRHRKFDKSNPADTSCAPRYQQTSETGVGFAGGLDSVCTAPTSTTFRRRQMYRSGCTTCNVSATSRRWLIVRTAAGVSTTAHTSRTSSCPASFVSFYTSSLHSYQGHVVNFRGSGSLLRIVWYIAV